MYAFSLKKKFNLFIICFLVVFSFNFIPKNISVIQKQNDPGMAARQNVLQYSFLDAKNPFILQTEIARADVGIGTLTAGGLALLEGVLMPYILGGLGVAGFLYGDTKIRQFESNVRRWVSVLPEVAEQLNQTASKKKVGDTVTHSELPTGLVQKIVYELGNITFDVGSSSQNLINNGFVSNFNSFTTEQVDLIFKAYSKLKTMDNLFNNDFMLGYINSNYIYLVCSRYSSMNFTSTFNQIRGSWNTYLYDLNLNYVTSTYSNTSMSIGFSSTDTKYFPLTDINLSAFTYDSVLPTNSVSYYPPLRGAVSNDQSISVPQAFPVSIPTDGTWTREPDATIPVSVPQVGSPVVSIPITDTEVVPIDDTNPDIPIPSEQTGFWSGLWEWLKAILKAILSIPGLIVTGIGNLLSALWEFLQSIVDGIGSIIASLTDSALIIDVEAVRDGIMEPFKLPRFQQTWNIIQNFDTSSVEPPKLSINLGQLFSAGTSRFTNQNPFINSDTTFIDFSLLNQYSFGGMALIAYFRFLTGVGFIWTTFNYCWRKLTPDTVI